MIRRGERCVSQRSESYRRAADEFFFRGLTPPSLDTVRTEWVERRLSQKLQNYFVQLLEQLTTAVSAAAVFCSFSAITYRTCDTLPVAVSTGYRLAVVVPSDTEPVVVVMRR